MNQEKNSRYRQTDERIVRAFLAELEKKPPEKVTVQDICRATGIHRSSFYLHYPDLPTLLEAIRLHLAEEAAKELEETSGEGLAAWLLTILRHTARYRDFYRAYLAHGEPEPITESFSGLFARYFRPFLRRLGVISEWEAEYRFAFLRSGFTALLLAWLRRGCPEPPEEIARILFTSVPELPENFSPR